MITSHFWEIFIKINNAVVAVYNGIIRFYSCRIQKCFHIIGQCLAVTIAFFAYIICRHRLPATNTNCNGYIAGFILHILIEASYFIFGAPLKIKCCNFFFKIFCNNRCWLKKVVVIPFSKTVPVLKISFFALKTELVE